MIKVKFLNAKKFIYSDEPKDYDFTMKNKKENLKGKITIDFREEKITVYLDRKLSYFERLEMLKEIFYEFCITQARIFRTDVYQDIEQFKFVDISTLEEFGSVIEELASYGNENFNVHNEKERILRTIIFSYHQIQNSNSSYVELPPLLYFSYSAAEIYESILRRLLIKNNYNGTFYELNRENETIGIGNAYSQYYRVFAYKTN